MSPIFAPLPWRSRVAPGKSRSLLAALTSVVSGNKKTRRAPGPPVFTMAAPCAGNQRPLKKKKWARPLAPCPNELAFAPFARAIRPFGPPPMTTLSRAMGTTDGTCRPLVVAGRPAGHQRVMSGTANSLRARRRLFPFDLRLFFFRPVFFFAILVPLPPQKTAHPPARTPLPPPTSIARGPLVCDVLSPALPPHALFSAFPCLCVCPVSPTGSPRSPLPAPRRPVVRKWPAKKGWGRSFFCVARNFPAPFPPVPDEKPGRAALCRFVAPCIARCDPPLGPRPPPTAPPGPQKIRAANRPALPRNPPYDGLRRSCLTPSPPRKIAPEAVVLAPRHNPPNAECRVPRKQLRGQKRKPGKRKIAGWPRKGVNPLVSS